MSDRTDPTEPAAGPPPDELDELQAALGAVLRRADPVPEGVLAMARAALTWRTIDAELAELVHDSAQGALAGVRGPGGPGAATRELGFEGPTRSLDLVVDDDGHGGRRLVGQVAPPAPGEVVVHHHGGSSTVALDELGRFQVVGLPAGPLHVTVAPAGGGGIRTGWFTP